MADRHPSLLTRLAERLLGRPPAPTAVPKPPRPPEARDVSTDEPRAELLAYLRSIAELPLRPLQCEPRVLASLARLRRDGRTGEALELARALAATFPSDPTVNLLVAELLFASRATAAMQPPLTRVLAAHKQARPAELRRARLLLAEAALASDDVAAARRHLEQLLAEDFHYPGARARLDALRPPDSPVRAPSLLAAGLGSGPAGAALGEAALPTLISAGGRGRYRIVRELGFGSTGAVYRAFDDELGIEVALKVFHPRLREPGRGEALLRALHEARVLAAMRHPGVVAVYDVLDEMTAGGAPLVAMELCRGGSLRQRLCAGPLPIAAALGRAAELCETLLAVHGSLTAHGDLKPENLLFRGQDRFRRTLPAGEAAHGDLLISDFGLAGLRNEPGALGLGTVGYLAPERLRGAQPTPAADLFAIGLLLLEMLLGEPPRPREQSLRGDPPRVPDEPPRPSLAAVWTGLVPLLRRLLSAEPGERPDAAAALSALQQLRGDTGSPSGGPAETRHAAA
jgi:hypothetical protein